MTKVSHAMTNVLANPRLQADRTMTQVADPPKQYLADALGVRHSMLMADSEDGGMP